MENKQTPEQEPQIQEIPLEMTAPEEVPVIEELTFQKESLPEEAPAEEIPLEAVPLVQIPEDPIPADALPPEETPVEEMPVEEMPVEDAPVEAPPQEPAFQEISLEELAAREDFLFLEVPFGEDEPEPPQPEPVEEIQPELPEEVPQEPDFEIQPMEPLQTPDQDQAYQDPGQDFDAMMKAPPVAQPKEEPPRMPRKGRPKRKKGEGLLGIPNILVTVVWLALIVAIGVTAGRMLWVCAADVLAFGREDKAVTVTIYEADTMDEIVDKLHNAGLIRYKSLFSLYASISDAEEDIQPGIYDLNTRYDYHALVNFMSPRSSREVIKVTIPEGYTCRQIFDLLEENRICTSVDLEIFAAEGDFADYWFLEGIEKGQLNRLEGFLFPDTYEFYKNSTPTEAIEKMLDNFNNRFTEEMRWQIETLNANVTGGGYTIREVVTVASLIEKESAAPAESPQIAGVIYNRLFRWEFPALLNIDAAIVYAQDGNADTINTSLDSPYNTYLNQGLTPTAIANPGLSSLQAALNPAEHNYYYYVLNPATGMHQFSTTQAEHDGWIAEFYG